MLDLLLDQARIASTLQHASGALLPGRNGAYGHPETPVRNSAHWLLSFCLAHHASGEASFRANAERALAFLLACVDQVPGGVPVRHAPGKDVTNGVLGQAHVVEALFYAAVVLGRPEAWQAGIDLIQRHRFNPAWQGWDRVTPSGKYLTPDDTFNHQLYFAATIALFAMHEPSLRPDLDRFVAGLRTSLRIRDDGRIAHMLLESGGLARQAKRRLREPAHARALASKEANYHLYNMYAFALLASTGLPLHLEGRADWLRAVAFVDGAQVAKRLTTAMWADGLPSGTETAAADLAFFRQTFGDPASADLALAEAQLRFTAGPDGSFSLYSPDPVTQRARSYRYWRLLPVDQAVRGAAASFAGAAR
ncbi:hypothetical protein [Sphingomonas profundi]|uniref:hypothetical protein n=1 Tax=Alterirhizorhabdus profundi TaxID=2681549 RepID=UPI0012E98C74|nr:hypothetical protein [Sphingomonas profundi]